MKNRIVRIIVIGATAVTAALGGWDLIASKVMAETPAKQAPSEGAPRPAQTILDERERGFIESLNKKQKELESREEELAAREERLSSMRSDIDARLEELKKVRASIEASLKKLDEINNDRVKRLIKIYETMSAEEAAARLEALDEDLAVQILSAMSEKKAAKALGQMNVGKSVRLSKSLKIKD